MERAPGAGRRRTAGTVRHLVHRPRSWLHPVAAAPDVEEEFVLAGELADGLGPFGERAGRHHDLRSAAEMVREAGEFIGHTHFGVPAARVGVFYRFDLRADDVAPWRVRSAPAPLDLHLRVRPDKVVDGVPRVLEFAIAPRIDDVPCGSGSASVVFLAPTVHRGHRERSRAALAAAADAASATRTAPGPGARVAPADVGRHLVGDVLLRRPVTPCPGQLAVDVALPPSTVPAHALLLEAVRQTALLTAWRAYALKPAHSTLGALRVHFRGYADPELPMRCTAVWDRLGKDADGRRLTPVTLSLVQAGSAVLEATASVVEDL